MLKSVAESTPPCGTPFCVPECRFVVVEECVLFAALDVICYVFEYCVGDVDVV